jgi:pilus assembly protein Flp/PilA
MEDLMKDKLWVLSIRVQNLLQDEKGQDLIEYALVVTMIAFAATATMGSLATSINSAFDNIGSKLNSATA